MCEQFLFYLRGVSFARVIVSRNGNLSVYKSALFLFLVRVEIIIFCTVSIEGITMSFIALLLLFVVGRFLSLL